jgi:hypothetical protein
MWRRKHVLNVIASLPTKAVAKPVVPADGLNVYDDDGNVVFTVTRTHKTGILASYPLDIIAAITQEHYKQYKKIDMGIVTTRPESVDCFNWTDSVKGREYWSNLFRYGGKGVLEFVNNEIVKVNDSCMIYVKFPNSDFLLDELTFNDESGILYTYVTPDKLEDYIDNFGTFNKYIYSKIPPRSYSKRYFVELV